MASKRIAEREKEDSWAQVSVLHGVYLRMLLRLSPARTRRFWRAHLDIHSRRCLDEADLYRRLWDPESRLPVPFHQRVLAALEDFLLAEGWRLRDFVDAEFFRMSSGSIWSSRNMLVWLKDCLRLFYQSTQPRSASILALAVAAENTFPGSWCRILSRRVREGEEEVHLGFTPFPDFSRAFHYDAEAFSIPWIRIFPILFGMPPYDHVRLVCDARPPEAIVGPDGRLEGGELRIGGRRHGRGIGFHNLAAQLGLNLAGQGVPDREVVLVEQDYHCPRRMRAVLRAGTALDAPLYITAIRHLLEPRGGARPARESYLDNLIRGLRPETEESYRILRERHEALLEDAAARLHFCFDASAGCLSLGDKPLFRKTPALILRRLLQEYARSGNRVFEYRFLKYDPEIFPNPKRTNLENRLDRMAARLKAAVPDVRILKIDSRCFSLEIDRPLDFRDR